MNCISQLLEGSDELIARDDREIRYLGGDLKDRHVLFGRECFAVFQHRLDREFERLVARLTVCHAPGKPANVTVIQPSSPDSNTTE